MTIEILRPSSWRVGGGNGGGGVPGRTGIDGDDARDGASEVPGVGEVGLPSRPLCRGRGGGVGVSRL